MRGKCMMRRHSLARRSAGASAAGSPRRASRRASRPGSAAIMSVPSQSGARSPRPATPTPRSTWARPIGSAAACSIDLAAAQDLARARGAQGPCRCPDHARPAAVPERRPGGGPEMAEAGGRERRAARDAGLRHRFVQWRRRRRRTRCSATPMSAGRPRRASSPAKGTLAQMDGIMPLAQRKKGAGPRHAEGEDAATEAAAKPKPRRAKGRQPPSRQSPTPSRAKPAHRLRSTARDWQLADPARRLFPASVGGSACSASCPERARCGPPAVSMSPLGASPASRSDPIAARPRQRRRAARSRPAARPASPSRPSSPTPRPSRAGGCPAPTARRRARDGRAGVGDLGQAGLARKATPRPASSIISLSLAPSPTARTSSRREAPFPRAPRSGHRAWPGHRRSDPRPRRSACRRRTGGGWRGRRSKPSSFGDRVGERHEPPDDEEAARARPRAWSGPALRRPDWDRRARRGSGAIASSSSPDSKATRSRSAALKSSSPCIARSVISAISRLRPAKSASSSRHSCPTMVESMSATSNRLKRGVLGLNEDVDVLEPVERPAHGLDVAA